MKIAIFSDSYRPIVNGVSVSIDALIDELRIRGHSVHIFTAGFSRHRDADPNIYRFPAVRFPFFPGYSLAVPPFYPMLRHFRKHTFDVIHTHTPYTIGFVGLRWAESHGIPIVSTYHTLYERYAHYLPFFPKPYIRYKIAKHTNYYYNRCRHVIVPSEAAANSLRRHSVSTPVSVIPTGNPPAKRISKDRAREEIGARPRERVLLYVGRIAKEKNISLLLEAAERIIKERGDARLWMIGDGPNRAESLRYARELGIGDRVIFTGAIPRSEVDKYYVASDLFLFSSTTETQGLVIGEAMSFGVPAIAVRGGGASAAIIEDETGFIVNNSAVQLADAALNALGNPALLGRLSENAKKAVKTWSHADACDRVLSVYEKVMQPPQFAVVQDKADVAARTN